MASVLQTMREGSGTQHPEEIVNYFMSRMVAVGGVFDKDNNHFLVEESDTPALSVDIRQGYAYVRKSNGQMAYPIWLKTEDATLAIIANASGNSRKDAIVLYVDLGATANPTISNIAKLIAVAGTPAGSPVAPDDTAILAAIGASNPYIVLAHVTVESGETTILDADIADQRAEAILNIGQLTAFDGFITAYGEYDNGNSGATKEIDWSKGDRQLLTLTDNVTLTYANAKAGQTLTLRLVQDAGGTNTVALPTSMWVGGEADEFNVDANGINLMIVYFDGTNYLTQLAAGFATP